MTALKRWQLVDPQNMAQLPDPPAPERFRLLIQQLGFDRCRTGHAQANHMLLVGPIQTDEGGNLKV